MKPPFLVSARLEYGRDLQVQNQCQGERLGKLALAGGQQTGSLMRRQ